MRNRILGVTALALAATACSGGSTKSSTQEHTSSTTSTFETPLGAAMGQLTESQSVAKQAKLEKLVQACMAKEGFEYVPVQQSATTFTAASFQDYGPQSEDWRKKYGYGIVEQRLHPNANFWGPPEDTTQTDPNAAITAKFSKAEMRAYEIALDGFDREAAFSDDGVTIGDSSSSSSEPKGCRAQASAKLFGKQNMDEATNQLMTDIYTTLDERINKDPRMKALLKKWRACIADAGFPEIHNPDPYDVISKQMEKIAPFPGEEEKLGSMPAPSSIVGGGSALSVGASSADTLTPEQKASLVKLQKKEIAIAKADYACQDKYQLLAESNEIRIDIERQLVKERSSDLKKIKAAGFGGGLG